MIRFVNATKQFSETSVGLRDVSFHLDAGEFVFLTGPSGSGKTTIIKLILREYQVTAGDVYFYDTPLKTLSASKVHLHRRKIGVVFQDYKLIPEMSVWENIALPLFIIGKPYAEIEQRVSDLLNLIKLPDKADMFPSQLSGGEAQRVSIARALASGPEVIIADEPTGNLDPETALGIIKLMHKINTLGTTVLIATHDKSLISQFPQSRLLRLEKGTLALDTKKQKTPSSESKKKESDAATQTQEVSVEVTPAATPQRSFWSKLFGKKTPSQSKDIPQQLTTEQIIEVDVETIDEPTPSEPKAEPEPHVTASTDKKKEKVKVQHKKKKVASNQSEESSS